MITLLRYLLRTILLLFFLLMIGVIFIITTQEGTQLAFHMANQLLPNQIKIQRVEGRLIDSFSLHDVFYSSSNLQVEIKNINVQWKMLSLLKGKLLVNYLECDEATFKKITSSKDTSKKMFTLPFTIDIKKLNVKSLNILLPDQKPITVKNVNFTGQYLENSYNFNFNITQLATIQKGIPLTAHINLQGTLKNTTFDNLKNVHFKIDSVVRWGSLSGSLQGNLSDKWDAHYKFDIPKLQQLIPTLNGNVNLVGNIKGPYLKPELQANIFIRQLKSADGSKNTWIENFQGKLIAELQLKGTLDQPKLQGTLNLKSKQLQISQLGLQLRNLDLNANMQDKVVKFNNFISSGPGLLQIKGTTSFTENTAYSSLTLSGKDFLVSNTPTLKISVSPDLRIENKENAWYVKGKIEVPSAEIKLAHITKTVKLPRETVIIQPSGEVLKKDIPDTFADVTVLTGEQVYFASSGLKSFITGKLQIKDYPNSETSANGRLEFKKGSYELKGQKLNLDQSALVFINSPISNPGLHIRASKTIHYAQSSEQTFAQEQTFLAGIQVTGNAENPNITLFSDPAGWSQADILSLIVLGQPASAISQGNVQLLAAAAQTLTPQGGEGINTVTQQVQQAFGLSEFGMESGISRKPGENKSSTSFVLGKYLSPRLYLNYSLGVIDSINTLRLRYLLSKHWSIQTQANTLGSGADILYSIEH